MPASAPLISLMRGTRVPIARGISIGIGVGTSVGMALGKCGARKETLSDASREHVQTDFRTSPRCTLVGPYRLPYVQSNQ